MLFFQHDLCPVHQSNRVRDLLEERGVAVMPWPPKGADMNPIENIWGNMKIQLSRRGLHSVTTDQLWDAVKEEWDRLRQCPELVVNLYESLPRRMNAICEANGEFCKY